MCVCDILFHNQGENDEQLPEVLLGVVRIRKLDVLLADNLEASEEHEVKPSRTLSRMRHNPFMHNSAISFYQLR